MSFAGKTAVVTGGASGLGAAIAAGLARGGAAGRIVDVGDPSALPDGWSFVRADVADPDAVAAALAGLGAPIDVLVAAAGIVPVWRRLGELDLDEWDAIFRVNARGVAVTLDRATPLLAAGASVVVIASMNAWRGDPNIASYVASKHAALGLVRSAALDLGSRGIRVNAIAPGPVATDALLERMRRRAEGGGLAVEAALAAAGAQTALGRMVTVEEVAEAALFLAGSASSGVTGHLLPVDAGVLT